MKGRFRGVLKHCSSITYFDVDQGTATTRIRDMCGGLRGCSIIVYNIRAIHVPRDPTLHRLTTGGRLICTFFALPCFYGTCGPSVLGTGTIMVTCRNAPLTRGCTTRTVFNNVTIGKGLSISVPALCATKANIFARGAHLNCRRPRRIRTDPRHLSIVTSVIRSNLRRGTFPNYRILITGSNVVVCSGSFNCFSCSGGRTISRGSICSLTSSSGTTKALLTMVGTCSSGGFALGGGVSSFVPRLGSSSGGGLTIGSLLCRRSNLAPAVGFCLGTVSGSDCGNDLCDGTGGRTRPIHFSTQACIHGSFSFLPGLMSTQGGPNFAARVTHGVCLRSSFGSAVVRRVGSSHLNIQNGCGCDYVGFVLLGVVIRGRVQRPVSHLLRSVFFDGLKT